MYSPPQQIPASGLPARGYQPPPLALHVLPGHQELVAPLPTGYVGPVMSAGETWMRRFGYRAIGPWLISWGLTGQPQLRRPVSGALRIGQQDAGFSAVEMPSLLMLAVPFRGWPVLPRDLLPYVRAQGLDPIGQPLLLAIGNEPPTVAWIPVTPRGTGGLMQLVTASSGSRKLGLLLPPPEPGVLLSGRDILRFAWFATLRVSIFITLLILMLFNCLVFFTVFSLFRELAVSTPSYFGLELWQELRYPLVIMAIIFGICLVIYAVRAGRWNNFWRERAAPPVLAIHGGLSGEESVPGWLG